MIRTFLFAQDTTLTVEHILPQNVKRGSGWERDFPDEVQRGEWVHRLGNLMLLSGKKNAGASDKDFEHKKTTYFLKKRKGAQVSVLCPLNAAGPSSLQVHYC